MKPKSIMPVLLAISAFARPVSGQAILSGTNYTQTFDQIGSGLPVGWSVRTNATATNLGTAALFNTANVSWATQTGQFGNAAGTTNNLLGIAKGTETSAQQGGFTNRGPCVRLTATFGDPGAAFVFQIANTLGFSNLVFSVDLNMLSVQTRSTTWTVDYAVSNLPAAFTALGTFSDPGVFGTTTQIYSLGADANNQPQNVWIRIVALSAATGTSGSRDTFGIDNFAMNYAGATSPSLVPLFIRSDGPNTVLTWNDASFALQAAPTPAGAFTNIIGATSPFTNALAGPAEFFRLVR